MAPFLSSVFNLLRERNVRRRWILLLATSLALPWLPLMQQPGYELATGLCLLLTVFGTSVAIASARTSHHNLLATAALTLFGVIPALLLATVRTWLLTACNPFFNASFVPVLVLPTALLSTAIGSLSARVSRAWLTAGGFIVLSIVSTVWPIGAGPQVFAFNHFGGFFPGPLYDEALELTPSLLWFRFASCCLACALTALHQKHNGWALLLFGAFAVLEWKSPQFGFRMTDEHLAQALGGTLEIDDMVLHYPLGLLEQELRQTVEDIRFRHHQIASFLGLSTPPKITVWLYSGPEEKQRLVGAAHTQFAKPWRREVHVNRSTFPHPVVKHELVHALAAAWGSEPFGVTASWAGLVPHMGVIEGFAVAADNPNDELSLHESAAAMKRKGLLPGVTDLMSPWGFYTAPPSRAYTVAGSFIRFLHETYGTEPLRQLYRRGDFEAAYNRGLARLAQEYEAFLDTVPLKPNETAAAASRFRRGSLFTRPCAREVSRLAETARDAMAQHPHDALPLWERCQSLENDEPGFTLAKAQTLLRMHRTGDAQALLDRELSLLPEDTVEWANAALLRADVALTQNEDTTALSLWQRIAKHPPTEALARQAWVREEGMGVDAVTELFQQPSSALTLWRLQAALEQHPTRHSLRYLLARRLTLDGAASEALPLLKQLHGDASLPLPVRREVARLLAQAAASTGECATLSAESWHPQEWGEQLVRHVSDWEERCLWEHGT